MSGSSAPNPCPRPASPVPTARATAAPRRGAPSRSADNLFWLGRYIERTESMVRLLRACHVRQAEAGAAAQPCSTRRRRC
ncbi:alpha-E domain-containing protein [Seohaeicola zhoushanensis]